MEVEPTELEKPLQLSSSDKLQTKPRLWKRSDSRLGRLQRQTIILSNQDTNTSLKRPRLDESERFAGSEGCPPKWGEVFFLVGIWDRVGHGIQRLARSFRRSDRAVTVKFGVSLRNLGIPYRQSGRFRARPEFDD
ncbi:penicillin-binding enzyme for formation ofrod-shaped peptidoglycan cell wall [Striga asiatica]|uniref:Penicillin-binding enzyme for formation ofrod-shaped peptidoglycan cell wall n=1 Tax=Striga asiatica TaxID=4170 RepID=A0A5A7QQ66_STRAF|nr:penicillin-binding enzyme for formation ofrod-shaped peptidoglycan cell wall [Striga asiatica]